jgi:hypothetical protein
MTSHSRATEAFERAKRLRSLGAWGLALGFIVGVFAVITSGLLPQLSPKSTTSTYAGLAGSGCMRWLFVPMIAVSAGLVGVGLLLRALAK